MFNIEQGGENMSYEYSKLLGKIKEKCGSQAVFACAMGLSERTMVLKLSSKRDWKQSEIDKACAVLDIPKIDIPLYFFTVNVQY